MDSKWLMSTFWDWYQNVQIPRSVYNSFCNLMGCGYMADFSGQEVIMFGGEPGQDDIKVYDDKYDF